MNPLRCRASISLLGCRSRQAGLMAWGDLQRREPGPPAGGGAANVVTPQALADTAARCRQPMALEPEGAGARRCEALGMGAYLGGVPGLRRLPPSSPSQPTGPLTGPAPAVFDRQGVTSIPAATTSRPVAPRSQMMKYDMGAVPSCSERPGHRASSSQDGGGGARDRGGLRKNMISARPSTPATS